MRHTRCWVAPSRTFLPLDLRRIEAAEESAQRKVRSADPRPRALKNLRRDRMEGDWRLRRNGAEHSTAQVAEEEEEEEEVDEIRRYWGFVDAGLEEPAALQMLGVERQVVAIESSESIGESGDPLVPECACVDPDVDREEAEKEEFGAVHLHRCRRLRWTSELV